MFTSRVLTFTLLTTAYQDEHRGQNYTSVHQLISTSSQKSVYVSSTVLLDWQGELVFHGSVIGRNYLNALVGHVEVAYFRRWFTQRPLLSFR